MKTGVMPVGQLSAEQMRTVLLAATAPPPLEGGRPWRFLCTPEAVELYADPVPVPHDPEAGPRNQLVDCGAALLNLRVAIRTQGAYPDTRLFPEPERPELVAVVRPQGREPVSPVDRQLADAIPRRRSHRSPFIAMAVSPTTQRELRRAAEIERAWLATIAPPQLPRLREILRRAETLRPDGAGGHESVSDCDPEPDRLLVVIGSLHDTPLSRVQAGQALQRVLLTATSAGLSSAFLTSVVAQPSTRRELRQLLGGGLWPQIMLRLGHGAPVPVPGGTSLDDVVTSDMRPSLVSWSGGVLRRGSR